MGWDVEVRPVVGHQAVCGELMPVRVPLPWEPDQGGRCGWTGPERSDFPTAQADAIAHARDHDAGWAAYNAALEDRDAQREAPAP